MGSMREIKTRIDSVQETMQITKAMKLISAAKLKKAKDQLLEAMPYFNRVKFIMADIMARSGGNIESRFFDVMNTRKSVKKGYIVLTGDRSLAGGYNYNIIKLTEKVLQDNPGGKLFVVGHVGRNHFMNGKYDCYQDFDFYVNKPTLYRARDIAEKIVDLYIKMEIDEFYIIYTRMITSMTFEPTIMQLLPLELESVKADIENTTKHKEGGSERCFTLAKTCNPWAEDELVYEPSPKAVFNVLASKYTKGILYGVLVEAYNSEHTARMLAMESATENAQEVLHLLKKHYNRERQAMITREISEVVAGAEALK